MKSTIRITAVAAAAFLAGTFATTVTQGQGDKWYPSRWGAADQRGAANRLTPAKVLDAKAMITKGTVYQLGRVYEAGMPLYGTRHYSLKIPYAFAMPGQEPGELPRRHHQRRARRRSARSSTVSGTSASASCSTTATAEVRLRHARRLQEARHRERRRHRHARRADRRREVQGRAAPAGAVRDHRRRSHRRAAAPEGGDPSGRRRADPHRLGIAVDEGQRDVRRQLARHRRRRGRVARRARKSSWSEPTTGASRRSRIPIRILSAPVHQLLLAQNGIYLHENLATEELARDNVYEFAYVFAPLRLKGATGSPGNPIAIR